MAERAEHQQALIGVDFRVLRVQSVDELEQMMQLEALPTRLIRNQVVSISPWIEAMSVNFHKKVDQH